MLGGMSGRRFLGIGCVSCTLLAIYACGDDGVGDVPDERADAGAIDGASLTPEGASTDGDAAAPELPPSSIALGEGFGCIVAADHTVYCWGRNDFGQLGHDPATTPSCGAYPCTPTPVKVEGLAAVIAIAAGKDFACALDDGKHVWCWGNNAKRQASPLESGAYRFTPVLVTNDAARLVAAGQHACALGQNGRLRCWGDNDCEVFGPGQNEGGTPGVADIITSEAKWVSLGPDAICTIRVASTEVYCWGADHKGSLGHPMPESPSTCASSGHPFDPTPKRWVSDELGHILTDVEEVHVGGAITCARKTDGTVLCAGDNSHGGLGQGLPDGDTHDVPVEVPAMKASKLAVAGETACGIVADKLFCWGDARYGQMTTGGLGTDCGGTACRPLGVVLEDQSGLRSFSLSPGGIATIKSDVSVWGWGRNDSGETGVAPSDPGNATCAGGVKCLGPTHQMPNVPPLK